MRPRGYLCLLLLSVASGCDSGSPPAGPAPDAITLRVALNPTGRTPLAAEATVTASEPLSVEVVVEGRGGEGTEMRHRFQEARLEQRIPILGLYPGSETAVTLRLYDAGGALVESRDLSIAAPALPAGFPQIQIDTPPSATSRRGVNLVSYFGHDGETRPQKAFAFDAAGAIRWVFDPTGDPALGGLFYDNGVERLANGNLYFGDRASNRIYEIDMLGRIVRQWALRGFSFHHQVQELPGGDFLVTVNRDGAATVEDHVIRIDRTSGALVATWDLRQSLDSGRRAWPTDLADLDVDWFHGNGLAFDPSDGGIVVSGRTQGLVKLTPDNQVAWILAPHRGWGLAGDGTDLSSRLLRPLNAAGAPITDPAVLDGTATHPDFEWAWYQHAPEVLPDGSLLLFDNGDARQYGAGETYSRAVIYRIDGAAQTIQQVWSYGRDRGAETYSRIVSDVDYHAGERHVVFMPGALQGGRGKVIEIDRQTGAVQFEATITPPQASSGITFHRVERLPLYPASPAPARLAFARPR